MTKDEALKLALDALHGFIPYLPLNDEAQCGRYDKAITAIKEALAQPEQEPEPMAFEKTVCPFCSSEWVTAEQHDRKMDRLEQKPVAWKLVPVEPTKEMLKAMDECSTEGYDERLYAGHAASVYMAAVDVAPTPPPVAEPHKRKPLSDEEIILIVAECASSHQHTDIHFARAIEQAHGIIAPTELKGEA